MTASPIKVTMIGLMEAMVSLVEPINNEPIRDGTGDEK